MRDHPHRGLIATVAMLGLIFAIGGVVRWEPVGRAFAHAERPAGLLLVLVGAWFLVSAVITIPKPYSGLLLIFGTLLAIPILSYQLEEAARSRSFLPLALGLCVFTAGGALLMLSAKISTETRYRRPWLQEAWPGMVLVLASLVVITIVATRTVPFVNPYFYIPGTMLPAERGP